VRRIVLSIAAAVTLLVAGCTTDAATPNTGVSVPPTSASAAGGGTINWTECQSEAIKVNADFPRTMSAFCGSVTVPQDWRTAKNGKPSDGKTFSIAVVKIHLNSDTHPMGNVLTNPGGPGASGIDFAFGIAGKVTNLLGHFDLISFDPRGVSRSNPIECISDSDLDAYYGYDPDPVSNASFQGLVTLDKHMGDSCGAALGKTLDVFTTEQAAHDIDAIRIALGDQKLNWLGFSYGTLLGATYAQLFPTHIRAMVLDGAVDPTLDPVAASETQAGGFEHAFDDFANWCKAHPSSCPISDNPRGEVTNAINAARTNPVVGPDGRKATAGLISLAVLQALYLQDFWTYMAQGINNLKKGDTRLIFALADQYSERDNSGHYSNTTDAFNAYECADSGAPPVDQIRSLQSQWRTKYPLFGASLAVGLLNCAEWPAARDPYPTGPAKGAPPIIVVGTTGDPATPYASTAKLANMLGVGHVITWQGEGHTAYLSSTCIQAAVDKYLIQLSVPAEGFTCPPN
jgi:pimeloyl-ACP methyl ester carboxylesterase